MTNHERTGRRTDAFLHLDFLAAALSAVATAGAWFGRADLGGWHALLAGVVVSIVLVRLARRVWLDRARSRQWEAALDAYAARDSARGRSRKVPPARVG
jgi:hypothetical protein